jgi:F-box-like
MLELMSSDMQTCLSSDAIARIKSELTLFRSPIQTSRSRSTAISSTDEEIEAAIHHILSLLARRDALAPIFLLPPELLARIFHFLALVEPSWSSPGKLGWIRATHVCQYWRQVALEDSSLWATISGVPESKRWIAEMLARAKCAPLAIDLDLVDPQSNEILSRFPSRFSHTRKLRLRGLSLAYLDNVRELCGLEAPVLEHFELDMSDCSSPVTFDQLIGTKFFKGKSPKLRTFSLCHVRVPWSLIPRAQLFQLRIVLPPEISSTSGISLPDVLNQFIDVLANSPGLEDLVLQYCLPSALSHFAHGRTIPLPRLSHLDLAGSNSLVVNLLKMLKLPSSTKLHLRCNAENVATYNTCLILPLLSAHFNNPKPVTFTSFGLSLDYAERSIVVFASSSLPNSTRPYTFGRFLENDAELCLSMDAPSNFFHSPNTLERMCTMLPITEVEFLSISSPDMVQPVNWGSLFRRFEKITTITARGHGTTTLLQTLTPPKPVSTTSGGGGTGKKRRGDRDVHSQGADDTAAHVPPVFPKLTTLVLRKLDFDRNVPRCGNLYDVLTNTLRRRKLHKVPLKSLTIEYSIISINRSNALSKLVQEFDCEYVGSGSDFVNHGDRLEDVSVGSSEDDIGWVEDLF